MIFVLRCSNILTKWRRMFTLSFSGSCCHHCLYCSLAAALGGCAGAAVEVPGEQRPLAEVAHTNASRRGHKPPLTPSSISNSCHKTALSSPSCLYNTAPKSPKEFPQVNLHLFKSILMRLCRYFTAKSATVQVRSLYSNPSDRISVLSSRCYYPSQVYLIQTQVYLIQLLCKST